MKKRGAAIVVTYGDPAYYGRLGFNAIGQDVIPPPFELTQPEGWLAQSLDGGAIAAIPGPSACVGALDDAVYW